MRVLRASDIDIYDLAIVGLGYESRSITTYSEYKEKIENVIAIGYKEHNDAFSYEDNLKLYKDSGSTVIEENDLSLFSIFEEELKNQWASKPINCLIDITVMSRSRLATILMLLMENLYKGSCIRVCYELAEFTPPPTEISPIRKIGPIIESLSGSLGDIELPSSVVLGLGYEEGKAIGISNFLDAEKQFLLIPESMDERFKVAVEENNKALISSTSAGYSFTYDVTDPYKSYLELRELLIAITEISRPIVVPLGPKILSALFVVLSKEMNYELPVWRVSSQHHEDPVDRKSSGNRFELNLVL